MIKISFNSTDQRVINTLKTQRAEVLEALRAEMDRLMFELLRRVQNKLSGEVLQPRSGHGLLQSARKEPTVVVDGRVSGRVTVGGGLASIYPAVQEFGGLRTYDIYPGAVTGKSDKQALAFFPGGAIGGPSGQLAAAGRALSFKLGKRRGSLRPKKYGEFSQLGGIVVRHVVHPPLPERSFIRSAEEEMKAQISERLRATLYRKVS